MYIPRNLQPELVECLNSFPAVAVLGPRRCGKSTLAKAVLAARRDGLYLDLEKPSDLARLREPELFLEANAGKLVCLDEIQRAPELFRVLRALVDENPRPGRFLILGSASPELLRQSSETLAGRIAFLDLAPFHYSELKGRNVELSAFHLQGGFPESILASSGRQSERWRRNFVRTFLERDLAQFALQVPAGNIERLWRMCAHSHGQLLNLSQLGAALGVSHTTVRKYLDLLSRTFMVRLLPPYLPNLSKRLVKSPRLYVRDSGILHALLGISTYEDLLGHPLFGASWEGLVIENALAAAGDWRGFFYRTAAGAELDLVLEKGARKVAVECKASAAPSVTTGFWNALEDLKIAEARIVAPVRDQFPLRKGVLVCPLERCLAWLAAGP
jgi:predicted AAA+ superfamily ATPase